MPTGRIRRGMPRPMTGCENWPKDGQYGLRRAGGALCRLHGVRELWTVDRDFSRFPGLKVKNPLVG